MARPGRQRWPARASGVEKTGLAPAGACWHIMAEAEAQLANGMSLLAQMFQVFRFILDPPHPPHRVRIGAFAGRHGLTLGWPAGLTVMTIATHRSSTSLF